MKHLLFILALLPLSTIGQFVELENPVKRTPKELRFGFSLNRNAVVYSKRPFASLLFTMNYRRHQFDIGPTAFINRNGNSRINGVETFYRFYPNGDDKKFTTFIHANLNYYNDSFDRVYFPIESGVNNHLVIHRNVNSLSFAAGYGIKFKFVKGFYISSQVGLGIGQHFYNRVNIPEGYEEFPGLKNHTIVGVQFGIGLGYKF